MKRVLVLADFGCATGFAQVSQNVVAQLLKDPDYQIDVMAINYFGNPNEWQGLYPQVRVFPARFLSDGDVFGRKAMLQMLSTGQYDILWILQDTFNIEPIADKILEVREQIILAGGKPFRWIFYFPIDAAPKENWVQTVAKADYPVAYTKYGYEECVKFVPELKDRLMIIPHGIDTLVFKPLSQQERDAFRKSYFLGRADGKFLITNVNRNQPRKDIPRTLQIFSLFKRQVPNALLYLHMKEGDVGWGINEAARLFDLHRDDDYIVPAQFDESKGLDVAVVNAIYNASDVLMTTTYGEGWGLSLTEAMAAKCPVIAPDHTSITEIVGPDKGVLVPAGQRTNEWVVFSNDNERLRPIVDVPTFVDKLVGIKNGYIDTKPLVENAYNYTQTLTWDKVGETWRQLFKEALPPEKKITVGRNDPCPCGSGKKFKACHYGV